MGATMHFQLYGEAASAQGMSIPQYLDQLQEFQQVVPAYKYRHRYPLVKPDLVNGLPTKMRRLHKCYMQASKEGQTGSTWDIKTSITGMEMAW